LTQLYDKVYNELGWLNSNA